MRKISLIGILKRLFKGEKEEPRRQYKWAVCRHCCMVFPVDDDLNPPEFCSWYCRVMARMRGHKS